MKIIKDFFNYGTHSKTHKFVRFCLAIVVLAIALEFVYMGWLKNVEIVADKLSFLVK